MSDFILSDDPIAVTIDGTDLSFETDDSPFVFAITSDALAFQVLGEDAIFSIVDNSIVATLNDYSGSTGSSYYGGYFP